MSKILIFLSFLFSCQGESFIVWDFFGKGVKDNGNIRYASLKPNTHRNPGLITEDFSICASLLFKVIDDQMTVIQVLDKDNLPWFHIILATDIR